MKHFPIAVMLLLLSGCAIDHGPPGVGLSPPHLASSWQLVRIQDGSGAVLVPDVKAKYTLDFYALGRISVRMDCNHGRGTWSSYAPGQLQFGQLELTKAACPPGSLHGRMLKQFPDVRSYLVKHNRLFLSLRADGGMYEFERM
jgi:para-nitrobenzyl esterase